MGSQSRCNTTSLIQNLLVCDLDGGEIFREKRDDAEPVNFNIDFTVWNPEKAKEFHYVTSVMCAFVVRQESPYCSNRRDEILGHPPYKVLLAYAIRS